VAIGLQAMKLNTMRTVGLAGMLGCLVLPAHRVTAGPPALPENLALRATATATSEYSDKYLAKFAADGQVPAAYSHADPGKAWCVKGATHRNGADLTLTWPQEVTVAEIVYYGRTAWFVEECWKDYEVYLDQAATPAAKGRFEMGHGPQRIKLAAPTKTKRLTLKFLSSYGGLNPGASEIQVFAVSPPATVLAKFDKKPVRRVEPEKEVPIVESPELVAKVRGGQLGFDKLLIIQRRELNPSHVYTYHVEGFAPGGGLYIYSLKTRRDSSGFGVPASAGTRPLPAEAGTPNHITPDSELKELVASPEGQILDCDLSYDAKQILFSWRRKKEEGYHVFVVKPDGTGLRQLTDGPHHNYNACWLPDGGIAFLSTRSARFAYCWISPVGLLHRMERDGSNVQRLSANIVNDFTPSVMEDGRIIYSRWEYVDKPAIPIQSLWTINPDGTGLAGFYGNRVLTPATFMEARTIPGTAKVLCVLTSHNGPCRGAIGIIDRRRGNNAQDAIQNLTPEVKIGDVDKGNGNNVRGPYESPYPLDQEFFLVSKRGTTLVRNYAGTQAAIIIKPRDGLGYYSARPLQPRQPPPVIQSGASFQLATTINNGHKLEACATNSWATVMLQDVYNGLEPHVQRGEVKQICVVQEMEKSLRVDLTYRAFDFQFPVISCGATYAGKKVWGYAPVEPDGSACFRVPIGVPIYFMALDQHGRAVQRMRTFTHLMPGEVQGCVGCHESREHASSRKLALAFSRPPRALEPPEWGQGVGFDYAAVVQPIFDRHCVRCHSGATPPAKVDLSADQTDFFNVSYETLARGRKGNAFISWDSPYVNWIPTYNGHEANILEITPKAWGSPRSKLADLLLFGHPDASGNPRVQLDDRERRRVFAWIDLNVPYYGTSEVTDPNIKGARQIYPADLDKTLADVAARRCDSCHAKGLPRQFWTRITNPQLNSFLQAPLAKTAGGTETCGRPIFQSASDSDYQAILKTFEPTTRALREKPRIDMPGAVAATSVDRSCLGKIE